MLCTPWLLALYLYITRDKWNMLHLNSHMNLLSQAYTSSGTHKSTHKVFVKFVAKTIDITNNNRLEADNTYL